MAVFNVLPIRPLDGGQALRELVDRGGSADRNPKRWAPERISRIATQVTLVLLLLPLFAARAWGILT